MRRGAPVFLGMWKRGFGTSMIFISGDAGSGVGGGGGGGGEEVPKEQEEL